MFYNFRFKRLSAFTKRDSEYILYDTILLLKTKI